MNTTYCVTIFMTLYEKIDQICLRKLSIKSI